MLRVCQHTESSNIFCYINFHSFSHVSFILWPTHQKLPRTNWQNFYICKCLLVVLSERDKNNFRSMEFFLQVFDLEENHMERKYFCNLWHDWKMAREKIREPYYFIVIYKNKESLSKKHLTKAISYSWRTGVIRRESSMASLKSNLSSIRRILWVLPP